VLVEELGTTLVTVAKDVKLQVEFDPAVIAAFRLIGYENRLLAHEEFADDAKDAGEIGAGHGVTALYELVPRGAPLADLGLDPESARAAEALPRDRHAYRDTLVVRVRYKEPEGEASRLLEFTGFDAGLSQLQTSNDFRFSAAVAAFGMVLKRSPHRGDATLASVRTLAAGAVGSDRGEHRAGFLALVDRTLELEGARVLVDRR
jgi:Ca-activated chloride channel family protein